MNQQIDGDRDSILHSKKAKDNEEIKIDEMQVTDEDFVPLELFDGVLAEFQHKYQSKRNIQLEFVKFCKEEAVKK